RAIRLYAAAAADAVIQGHNQRQETLATSGDEEFVEVEEEPAKVKVVSKKKMTTDAVATESENAPGLMAERASEASRASLSARGSRPDPIAEPAAADAPAPAAASAKPKAKRSVRATTVKPKTKVEKKPTDAEGA
ncbi:MAG: hypothetical protein Q8R44_09755, partial [Novosphingobium sp.]|nr:hypothetical protein [Novosphingobium sp.]